MSEQQQPAAKHRLSLCSHSGDIGDLLYHLTVLRHFGECELYLYPASCTGNRMTRERVASLRPLLELQPYISKVEYVDSSVGFVLDEWRNHYKHNKNLSDIVHEWLAIPYSHREYPWVRVDKLNRVAPVVFHRSPRYHNWNLDWRRIYNQYRDQAVFVGSVEEFKSFVDYCGPISYQHTRDYLELARVIAGADLFVGNQSSPRALAEALKVPVAVEVDQSCNNTHFQREGANYLYGNGCFLPPVSELETRQTRFSTHRSADRTLIDGNRLTNIARLVKQTRHLDGDLAELGVYRGGSARVISDLAPHKTLDLFDTFTGLPSDDVQPPDLDPEAEPLPLHKAGDFATNLTEVKDYLRLNDVEYHVGFFPETAKGLEDKRFCFAHIDGDLYETTRDAIEWFVPRLVPGGVLVFDDYRWERCPGVERAIREAGLNVTEGHLQAWWVKQ